MDAAATEAPAAVGVVDLSRPSLEAGRQEGPPFAQCAFRTGSRYGRWTPAAAAARPLAVKAGTGRLDVCPPFGIWLI